MVAIALRATQPYPRGNSTVPQGEIAFRVDVDASYDPGPDLAAETDTGAPVWSPPPPPPTVPPSVTNFQARAVLMQMPSVTGIADRTVFDDVNDTLRAEGGLSWQAWEQANDYTRRGVLVNSLGARLGLSEADLDALFIAASGIEA